MKATNITYWIITGIFAAYMIFTSIQHVFPTPDSIKFMSALGFTLPALLPLIGVMKVLGVIAILVPGFPRIKEWAYAGLFFDLFGASYVIVATYGLNASIIFMIIPIVFLFISYFLYHKRLKAV